MKLQKIKYIVVYSRIYIVSILIFLLVFANFHTSLKYTFNLQGIFLDSLFLSVLYCFILSVFPMLKAAMRDVWSTGCRVGWSFSTG